MVQHIRLQDGKEIALVLLKPGGPAEYQTSWEDHLQAIRHGERALLNLHIIKDFTYEITFDDGSTALFSFGGDEPLKKPQR